MSSLNEFINSLIPDRFRVTYEIRSKVKGAIYTQILLGVILCIVGLFYWIDGHILHELILNTGIGVFLLVLIFFLDRFNKFESYINFILTIGYIDLAIFTIKAGGVFADAPFWFALLIATSIFYTTTNQAIFWIITISLFMGILFYAQINGLDLGFKTATLTKKATTLISFYSLLLAIAFSFTKMIKTKNIHNLETIAKHKRLLKERDDLMSIIVHDMKSPSRRIEGLISIFKQDSLDKDQKEILERINKTARESTQLIDDLIVATSFQSSLSIEKTSINDLINDLQTGFLPLASKKNIRIITRGLRSRLWIETSSYQLRRVLDNLLSNAVKFSPMEKRIEIICVQNKNNTSISINDQGPGFNKEDEERMFKMFQKLSARPTGGESSTGLGLSIVKNLTELLKGEIKYVTQVNKGSTFTLVLPNKYPNNTATSA
jgi:signal transduction histidine kinase